MSAEQEKQLLYKQYLDNRKLLDEKAAAEKRRLSTYLAMAVADSEDIGGRFKKVAPMSVVGATPVPEYPRQPEGSPWSQQWPNDPDPLGYSVEDSEPVGSEAEIEEAAQILRDREAAAVTSPVADCADVAVSAATVSLAADEPLPTSAPQSSSSSVGIGVSAKSSMGKSASATERAALEAADVARSSSSQSSAALQPTLATRGSALNEQRSVADPRPFRRRL
jgi:hypothetical protein